MRFRKNATSLAFALLVGTTSVQAAHAAEPARGRMAAAQNEDYVREQMPPGFQVTHNEREGAIFADARGRTLYTWPFKPLRIGEAGDRAGASNCTNEKLTVNGGYQEPYPGGLLLPDLENRRSCAEVWPPVLATVDAKAVGKWTVIDRNDGTKQWAYSGQPVYTSSVDQNVGDVLGHDRLHPSGAGIAPRYVLQPRPNVPPGFQVTANRNGRVLRLGSKSVYTWDGDKPNKSNCNADCLRDWTPVLAPALAEARGEFTVVERAPDVKQWAFRGKPLYTNAEDQSSDGRTRNYDSSLGGADVPGWHAVYTQKALPPPNAFKLQDTPAGVVLADRLGKTVYFYVCIEDTKDNFTCDHPDAPQDYRLAICGGLDPVKCNRTFPYILAEKGAKSASTLFSVMTIDPMTGRRAKEDQKGALSVWAYRARPLYTFYGDEEPGDINGDSWGEKSGSENGFHAFTLQDD